MIDNSNILGIDVGSRTTKAVVWNGDTLISKAIMQTGWSPSECVKEIYAKIVQKTDASAIERIVITGYGRISVKGFADKTVTEITAHACGIHRVLPQVKTLIDIGGQDSKAIILDENGFVMDFLMNDRCAAGSGKFLEFLALSMNTSIEEFAALAMESQNPAQISSLCTVFAESEIISLLAEGASREDVAAGVHRAIAMRVANMVKMLSPITPIAISGGVANNRCIVRELSQLLGAEILVPEGPDYIGALGAAVLTI